MKKTTLNFLATMNSGTIKWEWHQHSL